MFAGRQAASAVHPDGLRGPDVGAFHSRKVRLILLTGAACTVFAAAFGTSMSVAAALAAGHQAAHATHAGANVRPTKMNHHRARRTRGAAAPVAHVRGRKLSWSAQAGVTRYNGAISTAASGGSTTYHRLGYVTSWRPTPQPGFKRFYSVASEGPAGEKWSARIAIAWSSPRAHQASATKLKVGVMDLGNYNYPPFYSASVFGKAGISYTREDVDRGQDTGTCTATDYVCVALSHGITPLVLFEGYADSNMTTEIVALAQKLKKLAVTYPAMNRLHVLEFGNEVWAGTSGPAENAATYGRQYNAAHAALAAAGLGDWKLLAIGNGLGTCVNSYTSANWINQVIAAQSSRAAGVDGWTVHPYGPVSTDFGCGAAGQGYGWPEVVDYHNIAVKAGSTAPWYVTEVGQCLGGSGCNTSVSMGSATDLPQGAGPSPYYTQAADMTQYMTDAGGDKRTGTAAKYPWIAALIWYQAYDDGSGWFGLLSNGSNLGQPVDYQRPSFTALQNWIATNGQG
jgi:hypothetical protein